MTAKIATTGASVNELGQEVFGDSRPERGASGAPGGFFERVSQVAARVRVALRNFFGCSLGHDSTPVLPAVRP